MENMEAEIQQDPDGGGETAEVVGESSQEQQAVWTEVCSPKAARQRSIATNDKNVVFIKGKTRNIAKVNPIEAQRIIIGTLGQVDRIYIAGRESLKIICLNEAQKQRILAATVIGDIEIVASEPVRGFSQAKANKLATNQGARGVIVGVGDDISNAEIISETEGVVTASRIYKTQNGRRIETTAFLLTFDMKEPPEFVSLGYRRYRVREFNPPPTRCYHCQIYGHTAKSCRASVTCPVCAGRHKYEDCDKKSQPKCANCSGNHSSAYKGCVKYKAAAVITQAAVKQGVSYAAAAKQQKAAPRQNVPPSAAMEETTAKKLYVSEQPITAEADLTARVEKVLTECRGESSNTTADNVMKPAGPQTPSRKRLMINEGLKTPKKLRSSKKPSTLDSDSEDGIMNLDSFRKTSPPRKKTQSATTEDKSTGTEPTIRAFCTFLTQILGKLTETGADKETLRHMIVQTARMTLNITIEDLQEALAAKA
jgi:hypothetical protein